MLRDLVEAFDRIGQPVVARPWLLAVLLFGGYAAVAAACILR
jgi:hypothetical protein